VILKLRERKPALRAGFLSPLPCGAFAPVQACAGALGRSRNLQKVALD
jgi:hypothetical protein